jgi:hypothetical protein
MANFRSETERELYHLLDTDLQLAILELEHSLIRGDREIEIQIDETPELILHVLIRISDQNRV